MTSHGTRRELIQAGALGAGALLLAPAALLGADPLPRRQLGALRAAVRGPVLAPGDRRYARARLVFNQRFDGLRPPAVVRVRDVADVQAVVRWADRFDVPLVVRAGGHAYNGASMSNSAVVIDVGGLNGVQLSEGIVQAGPGARLLPLYAKLAARGVAVPGGSCPSVALGGLALGGGMGLAGRAYGLTLDRVRALQVVMANGQRARVTGDDDLFWALRGGGGSFAVVTRLELEPVPARAAAWFRVTYPTSGRAAALAAWDQLAPSAPAALTAILSLTGSGATAFGQYLGAERQLGQLVAPLADVAGARLSTGTDTWLNLQRRWAGCTEASIAGCADSPRSMFDASSIYVARRLSAQARSAFVQAANTGATLLCDAYGGTITDVAPNATAFAHRDARFSVQIVSYAPLGTARSRVRRARRMIAPFGTGGAYPNYSDLDLRGPLHAYYGDNLARLRAIKRTVDPNNRFRPAQGIRA